MKKVLILCLALAATVGLFQLAALSKPANIPLNFQSIFQMPAFLPDPIEGSPGTIIPKVTVTITDPSAGIGFIDNGPVNSLTFSNPDTNDSSPISYSSITVKSNTELVITGLDLSQASVGPKIITLNLAGSLKPLYSFFLVPSTNWITKLSERTASNVRKISQIPAGLTDCAVLPNGKIVACGSFGKVYISSNSFVNYTAKIVGDANTHFTSVCFYDQNIGYLGGVVYAPAAIVNPNLYANIYPVIYKTTDGGNTWSNMTESVSFGYSCGISDIAVAPDNPDIVYATIAGDAASNTNLNPGTVVTVFDETTTTTSTTTTTTTTSTTTSTMTTTTTTTETETTTSTTTTTETPTTIPQNLLRSTDGGATWTLLNVGDDYPALAGVSVARDGNNKKGKPNYDVWVTGAPYGVIVNIISQISGKVTNQSVRAFRPKTFNVLYKSTDSGNDGSWTAITIDPMMVGLRVQFLDKNNGFLTGLNVPVVAPSGVSSSSAVKPTDYPESCIFKTTGGGGQGSWSDVSPANPYGTAAPMILGGLHFKDVNMGTAVGMLGVIEETENGGANWKYSFGDEGRTLMGVQTIDKWNAWAVGGSFLVPGLLFGQLGGKSNNPGISYTTTASSVRASGVVTPVNQQLPVDDGNLVLKKIGTYNVTADPIQGEQGEIYSMKLTFTDNPPQAPLTVNMGSGIAGSGFDTAQGNSVTGICAITDTAALGQRTCTVTGSDLDSLGTFTFTVLPPNAPPPPPPPPVSNLSISSVSPSDTVSGKDTQIRIAVNGLQATTPVTGVKLFNTRTQATMTIRSNINVASGLITLPTINPGPEMIGYNKPTVMIANQPDLTTNLMVKVEMAAGFVAVYPMPVTKASTFATSLAAQPRIAFTLAEDMTVRLIVTDPRGGSVALNQVYPGKAGYNEFYPDFKNLPPGAYILQIADSKNKVIATYPFVKL